MKIVKEKPIQDIMKNLSWAESKLNTKEQGEREEKRKYLLKYCQKKIDHILKVLYNEYAEETPDANRHTRR